MERSDETCDNKVCEAAESCRQIFDTCVSSFKVRESTVSIRSAQGDFNIWCSTIKATSRSKSSLDYRLRNHLHVRDAVCDLLNDLKVSLVEYDRTARESLLGQTAAPESPSSTDSLPWWDALSEESTSSNSLLDNEADLDPDPFVAECLLYIRSTLDQLARLSLKIRKSGNKYRFEKIDKKIIEAEELRNGLKRGKDAEHKEDKFAEFRKHLSCIILKQYPDPEAAEISLLEVRMDRASDHNRLTVIQQRLVYANILRRNRIENQTKSRDSANPLASPEYGLQSSQPGYREVRVPGTPSTSFRQTLQTNSAHPGRQDTQTTAKSVAARTATTATGVGSSLDEGRFKWGQSPSKVTNVTRVAATQTYPRYPKPSKDAKVVCPYCDDVLQFSGHRVEERWKLHVCQDILPYTCFVEGCTTHPEPPEMFLTSDALLGHLVENHSTLSWPCSFCASDNMNSGEAVMPRIFPSAETWEHHVAEAHEDRINAPQRPFMAELTKRPMIGSLSCPLCNEIETPVMDFKIDDHILQHLHEFALWSLPVDTENNVELRSKDSQPNCTLSHTDSKVHTWLTLPLTFPAIDLANLSTILNPLRALCQAHEFRGIQSLSEFLDWAQGPDWASRSKAEREFWGVHLGNVQHVITACDEAAKGQDSEITGLMLEELVSNSFEGLLDCRRTRNPHWSPSNETNQDQNSCHIDLPQEMAGALFREDDLEELEAKMFPKMFQRPENLSLGSLKQPRDQVRVVLEGGPSVGKTTLAAECSRQTAREHPNCAIFWVNASDVTRVAKAYQKIWNIVGEPQGPLNDPIHALVYYLNWELRSPWMMILDGIQSQTLNELMFKGWIPSGLSGRLLFTTQDASWRSTLGSAEVIQVKPHPRRFFDVPHERDESFVGHEDILSQLLSRVPASIFKDTCQRTAIVGRGRAPKTQIALEAAYRIRDTHPKCSIFWVSVANATTFNNACRHIAALLELPRVNNDAADVKILVKKALSQESAGEWLLIIDHADDFGILFGKQDLSSHFPSSRKGSILVLTDNHHLATKLEISGQAIFTTIEDKPAMYMHSRDQRADSLVEAIQDTYKQSTFPSGREHPFSPAGSLASIITATSIHEILGSPQKGLVDYILQKAVKLFAIMLIIDLRGEILRKAIKSLSSQGICDNDLPINRQAFNADPRLACCKGWRPNHRENFLNWQWRFLVPLFALENSIERIQFPPNILFPFELSRQKPLQGGFAVVWRANVHPPHFGYQQVPCEVAIKQFFAEIDFNNRGSAAYKDWEREVTALQTISHSHSHIVECFAIFEHLRKEYFMFPWAKRGNLSQFIKQRSDLQANRDPEFVLEILSQLIGLASAILTMHKRKYRHGDLKPHNILIFSDETSVGTWKVADFGLAKFHNMITNDRAGPTTMVGMGTISYEAPETATTSNSPRSRLYDIWSMGCVILQLAICLLYGEQTYIDLTTSTRNPASQNYSSYWQATWDGNQWKNTELHQEVVKVTDKLLDEFGRDKSSGVGAFALAEIARLARTRLLVVQLPGPELPNSACRARADELHLELQQIQERLKHGMSSHRPPPASTANIQVQPRQQ